MVIIYVKSDCHLAKSLISLSRTIAVIRYMNLSLYAKISGLVIMQEKSDFLMAEDTTFKYIEGKFILKVDWWRIHQSFLNLLDLKKSFYLFVLQKIGHIFENLLDRKNQIFTIYIGIHQVFEDLRDRKNHVSTIYIRSLQFFKNLLDRKNHISTIYIRNLQIFKNLRDRKDHISNVYTRRIHHDFNIYIRRIHHVFKNLHDRET